jgi:hypothetical protein
LLKSIDVSAYNPVYKQNALIQQEHPVPQQATPMDLKGSSSLISFAALLHCANHFPIGNTDSRKEYLFRTWAPICEHNLSPQSMRQAHAYPLRGNMYFWQKKKAQLQSQSNSSALSRQVISYLPQQALDILKRKIIII